MRRRAVAAVMRTLFLGVCSACAAVSPNDLPPAAAAEGTPAVEQVWPAAATILRGVDVRGERQLRDGDQVLYGIELARGETVTRNLLRIVVHRGKPAKERGTLSFRGPDDGMPSRIPSRVVRQVELEFTLFDESGVELMRSRCEPTPDFFFEESFVRGITGAREGDTRSQGIASARLLQIVRLLQQDPILKRLLGEVASVPFDLRLLFRRDITLMPSFEKGTEVATNAADPLAALPGARFDLPFDLLLNDSAFVRLSATVSDPCGPTGAAAGIVLLRAQQASDPTRQVRLQLLACARGKRTDWQAHGMLVACGAVDEGQALAFSPDGRWVAMPGERGIVELRDLAAADPTVPFRLHGGSEPVGALAFVDAKTLLVGRGARVELFGLGGELAGTREPTAVVPAGEVVCALELATQGTCFVGLLGGALQRWTFGAALATPAIEVVRAAVTVQAQIGEAPPLPMQERPPPGFLVTGDEADRVVVGAKDGGTQGRRVDFEYRRSGDGTWSATELPPLPKGHGRAARWRRGDAPLLDRFSYGAGWVQAGELGNKCFGANVLLMMSRERMLMIGRGDPDRDAVVHGFDPSGRFWAFVAPGYRVLVDCNFER